MLSSGSGCTKARPSAALAVEPITSWCPTSWPTEPLNSLTQSVLGFFFPIKTSHCFGSFSQSWLVYLSCVFEHTDNSYIVNSYLLILACHPLGYTETDSPIMPRLGLPHTGKSMCCGARLIGLVMLVPSSNFVTRDMFSEGTLYLQKS